MRCCWLRSHLGSNCHSRGTIASPSSRHPRLRVVVDLFLCQRPVVPHARLALAYDLDRYLPFCGIGCIFVDPLRVSSLHLCVIYVYCITITSNASRRTTDVVRARWVPGYMRQWSVINSNAMPIVVNSVKCRIAEWDQCVRVRCGGSRQVGWRRESWRDGIGHTL